MRSFSTQQSTETVCIDTARSFFMNDCAEYEFELCNSYNKAGALEAVGQLEELYSEEGEMTLPDLWEVFTDALDEIHYYNNLDG